jgi:hypothetical protein
VTETQPRPDQAYLPPPSAVPAGSRSATFTGRVVIITGPAGGLFVYSPAAGNGNLIASIAGAGGTDPYGNTYPAGATFGELGAGTTNIDPQGDIILNNAAGQPVIFLSPALSAILVYAPPPGIGQLLVSAAAAAGTDQYGNAFPAGLGVTGGGTGTVSGSELTLTPGPILLYGSQLVTSTVLTGAGNFLIPAGVTSMTVEAVGGGQGGQYGGGQGGNAGEYARDVLPVTAGNSYAYSVGTGGAGGTAGSHNGANGTLSTIAGDAGKSVTANPGTSTGGGTGSTAAVHFNGGTGGLGYKGSGGGGGGSGGSAVAGNNGGQAGPGGAAPVFGCASANGAFPSGMVGSVGAMAACKAYNSSSQSSWPGSSFAAIPSGVTVPEVAIKLALTPSSPYISSSDQADLASFCASMPVTGTPILCINQEGEASRFGYTAAQVAGSNNTAFNIFKANAPANAVFCQNIESFSATSGGRGSNFKNYLCCAANGQQNLPLYMIDWYPTSTSTNAVNSITPALTAIRGKIPNALIGIGEVNYTTNISGGITWSGGSEQWFDDAWSYAVTQGFFAFITYFYGPNGVPWPPPNDGTVAELAADNAASGTGTGSLAGTGAVAVTGGGPGGNGALTTVTGSAPALIPGGGGGAGGGGANGGAGAAGTIKLTYPINQAQLLSESISANAGTDSFGNVYPAGYTSFGAPSTTPAITFESLGAANPTFQIDQAGTHSWGAGGGSATDVTVGRQAAGILQIVGADLDFATAGQGLRIKAGSNCRMGTATLSGGTVTVNNTTVTANTKFFFTPQTGGPNTGVVYRGAQVNGVSFTITSSNAADGNQIGWLLIEPG